MKTEKVDNIEITAENKGAPKRNVKEAILEEATDLFYEVGYARTTIRDVAGIGLDLEASVKNLTDRDYKTPGTYDLIEGDPLTVSFILRKRW